MNKALVLALRTQFSDVSSFIQPLIKSWKIATSKIKALALRSLELQDPGDLCSCRLVMDVCVLDLPCSLFLVSYVSYSKVRAHVANSGDGLLSSQFWIVVQQWISKISIV
jgi:hypothetical protein